MKSITAYTAICEEDAHYIDQYLAEIERLSIPFAIHLDRCSDETKRQLTTHQLCVGSTEQNDPDIEFNEMHKQPVFDVAVASGADWTLAWDIDETWEHEAPAKIVEISDWNCDLIGTQWKNLWNDSSQIRIDGPFSSGSRVKFHNLKTRLTYRFLSKVINGPKPHRNGKPAQNHRWVQSDLVCIHWGLITREDRLLHKERWDRIYTEAAGGNPSGFWSYAYNEKTHPPMTRKHEYFA